jgi:hypothetical protein
VGRWPVLVGMGHSVAAPEHLPSMQRGSMQTMHDTCERCSSTQRMHDMEACSRFTPRQTLQVWDYISDGYVHRLIQSSLDGKLVEVPSPEPSSLRANVGDAGSTATAVTGGCCMKAASSSAETSAEMTRAMHEDYHMLQVCFSAVMRACAPAAAPPYRPVAVRAAHAVGAVRAAMLVRTACRTAVL